MPVLVKPATSFAKDELLLRRGFYETIKSKCSGPCSVGSGSFAEAMLMMPSQSCLYPECAPPHGVTRLPLPESSDKAARDFYTSTSTPQWHTMPLGAHLNGDDKCWMASSLSTLTSQLGGSADASFATRKITICVVCMQGYGCSTLLQHESV